MESDKMREYVPPDWGAGYDIGGGDLGIGEGWGQAGPSDYARRAYLRERASQAGRVKEISGELDLEVESSDLSAAPVSPQYRSSRLRSPSRRRSRTSRINSVRNDGGLDANGDVYEEEEDFPDNGDCSPRLLSTTTDRPQASMILPPTFLLPFALLPLLPLASAAPPIFTRPTQTSTSTSATTRPNPSRQTRRSTPTRHARRDVHFITSASPPAVLPTGVVTVDETVLPYMLSQGSDGFWTRATDGWRLYGRQSGETPIFAGESPSASSTSTTFAIEEVLPPGWGVQSTRTDLYRVPLIVIASCIIAVGLVVSIIVVALKRKKAHRRAKRRAERKRRKALAAAGLTEEGVNDSRNQANLTEKLEDLQRQHRAKRKGETGVVSSAGARSKVRNWRAGLLRRRKGKGGDGDPSGDGVIEEKVEDLVVVANGEDRDSQETDRSTPTVPSSDPDHGSGSDGLGSRLNTISSQETTAASSDLTHGTAADPNIVPIAEVAPTTTTATGTYFPPAYRPASVRSLALPSSSEPRSSTSGNSHSSTSRPTTAPSGPTEKIHAPGYYPAPATAEGEVALAVASRAEGKSRMILPAPEENETAEERGEHTGHAATDDKRVLERMRMAASAPPIQDGAEGDDGPSAPGVDVDGDGFERMLPDLYPPADTELASTRATLAPPMSESSSLHPELPLPPAPRSRPGFERSYSAERGLHEQLDELNLLPSAPPTRSPRAELVSPSVPPMEADDIVQAVPSAPPMLDDVDEEDEVEEAGPSAPLLPEEDEEGEETVEVPVAGAEVEEVDEPRRPSEAPSEPRLFLPKYEP